jgi:hypothetical protein
LVRSKLAGHPALRDLDEEAAAAADSSTAADGPGAAPEGVDAAGVGEAAEAVSELTREQLVLSLRAAIAKDREFATQLAEALAAVQAAEAVDGPAGGTSMTATAFGQGRVYQAGRDQHIRDR